MTTPFNKRTTLAVALWCGLITVEWAQAAPPPVDFEQLRRMAPEQANARVVQQIERQKSRRQAGALDTTPPVLTRFNAARSVDVTQPLASLLANIHATDELSGFWSALFTAIGPGGQALYLGASLALPVARFSGTIGYAHSLTGFEEPGEYTYVSAYLYDGAGNLAYYGREQLAALGHTSFTLKNKRGHDGMAPQLVSGKVLTPRVSLAATHPGTAQPAMLGISVGVSDAGGTAVSGVWFAYAEFCLADGSSCFTLHGGGAEPPGRAAATIALASRLDPTYQPGEYRLRYFHLRDHAQNAISLQSTEFGGPTDFSAYFPSVGITLVP